MPLEDLPLQFDMRFDPTVGQWSGPTVNTTHPTERQIARPDEELLHGHRATPLRGDEDERGVEQEERIDQVPGRRRVRQIAPDRRQVADLSVDVAEKIVGDSITVDTQRELVDRYIDELGGVQ